ncbi:MAG: hypothetical protein AAFU79_15810 [Myxococcota bacterium]
MKTIRVLMLLTTAASGMAHPVSVRAGEDEALAMSFEPALMSLAPTQTKRRRSRALKPGKASKPARLPPPALAPSPGPTGREANCEDRIDDDGDSLTDCLDSDCYDLPVCRTVGGLENTDLLCSDGIDNDSDGAPDCEDKDCHRLGLTACAGSWKGPLSGIGLEGEGELAPSSDIPELGAGMSFEDLIGTGKDIDGERNDLLCSDGYDNDGDGLTDCQDYGCRFDPEVSVCQPQLGGVRFSVWAHAQVSRGFDRDDDDLQWDASFNRIQLRAFGEFPFIQNSFFLLSVRADRTPRLTFATFQLPLGGGHFFVLNAGSGALSNGLTIGTQKNILLDRAFYLFTPFEAGNGITLEQNGPLIQGLLEYRYFVAAGAGNFNGNIGGRFFDNDNFNFTWGAGAQLGFFPFGRFDRWDSRFLYTPTSLGLSFYLGGRYDERALERFPAANLAMLFRWNRLLLTSEGWVKRELNFGAWQASWNVTAGILVIPRWLMIAADVGQFFPGDYDDVPSDSVLASRDFDRQTDQFQWRVAAHLYAWRNNGVISLLYTDNQTEQFDPNIAVGRDRFPNVQSRELRLEARLGF